MQSIFGTGPAFLVCVDKFIQVKDQPAHPPRAARGLKPDWVWHPCCWQTGRPINNDDSMAKSTLLAIMSLTASSTRYRFGYGGGGGRMRGLVRNSSRITSIA